MSPKSGSASIGHVARRRRTEQERTHESRRFSCSPLPSLFLLWHSFSHHKAQRFRSSIALSTRVQVGFMFVEGCLLVQALPSLVAPQPLSRSMRGTKRALSNGAHEFEPSECGISPRNPSPPSSPLIRVSCASSPRATKAPLHDGRLYYDYSPIGLTVPLHPKALPRASTDRRQGSGPSMKELRERAAKRNAARG